MAEIRWTAAQAAAIADRGGALLVSAAAGSGKTAVLAERAVGLITDPEAPAEADRLLILTFTNAAAAELRARIAGRLGQKARENPADARLRRQRMLLQRAPIGTIDAFCLDLLRRHFSALDIPPDFAPGDSGTLRALRDEALTETLEEAVQDEDFCAFADLYGKGRTDQAAGAAVEQLYDFLQALPDPDGALADFLAPWAVADGFADTAWRQALCARVRTAAQGMTDSLQRALAATRADQVQAEQEAADSRKTAAAKEKAAAKAREKYAVRLERLEADLAFYRQAAALAAPAQGAEARENWQQLCALLAPYRAGTAVCGFKGLRGRPGGAGQPMAKAVADQSVQTGEKLLEWVPATLEELEADRRTAAPLLAALGRAAQDFGARYYAKKLEKKLLDFADFEHLALRLLRTPEGARTPLCRQISDRFDAVMVDEYQDTNALQDALYTCLARPDGSNLFFVGDIKQSIYRFRQADPAVFAARETGYPPLGGGPRPRPAPGQAAPAALALDANFRSAPAVVAGVNYLFEQLMSPVLGGVTYGPGQRLVCGVPDAAPGGVEAAVLPTKDPAAEARWVARRIRQLVADGTPVRAGGALQPAAYGDCCILLATRGDFGLYSEALAAEGIPVYADASEDLLSAPQLRPLVALLRVIDNPARNIELAAAMRSALFGFTDDDLVRLRAAGKRQSLYGALVAAAAGPAQDDFSVRCRTFYARLGTLRRLAASLPVDRLLEEIFARTGYLAAVGAGPNGARRRDEVRRFAAWAAASGAGGLDALIRAMDATEAAGGLVDAAPGQTKPGCVSIMTVHRSKGLQFPVVILAGTGHRFNLDDQRRPVLVHRTLGLGLNLRCPAGRYPTAARLAIQEQIREETLSEQMRLLYVALTRAQDWLLLTVPREKPEEAAAKAATAIAAGLAESQRGRAQCFADWLLPVLLCHPDGGALRAAAGAAAAEGVLPADTASRLTIRLETELPEAAQAPQTGAAVPAGTPDPARVAALRAGFAWRYPALAETEVPAKVSVTSLVHRSDSTRLERPAFLSREGMTGAERGTALHAFLERADFAALGRARAAGPAALDAAIQAETDRQRQERLLAPEALAALDAGGVRAFVQGAAFDRILAAKRVWREYAFITGLPADLVQAAAAGQPLPGDLPAAAPAAAGPSGSRENPAPAGAAPAFSAGAGGMAAENPAPSVRPGDLPSAGTPASGPAQPPAVSAAAAPAPAAPQATVLVQGIADLVLEFDDHLELIDYKTDRGKDAAALLAAYRPQLALYARALEVRFAPKKVTRQSIYSFALGRLLQA